MRKAAYSNEIRSCRRQGHIIDERIGHRAVCFPVTQQIAESIIETDDTAETIARARSIYLHCSNNRDRGCVALSRVEGEKIDIGGIPSADLANNGGNAQAFRGDGCQLRTNKRILGLPFRNRGSWRKSGRTK